MNMNEHRLTCLMEECAEVAQRASKQKRFGMFEVQPGQTLTNTTRMRDEAMDLLMCLEFLVEAGQMSPITPADLQRHRTEKMPKINAMLQRSFNHGCLDELVVLSDGSVAT